MGWQRGQRRLDRWKRLTDLPLTFVSVFRWSVALLEWLLPGVVLYVCMWGAGIAAHVVRRLGLHRLSVAWICRAQRLHDSAGMYLDGASALECLMMQWAHKQRAARGSR